MNELLIGIVLLFFVFVSLIDFKFKAIPSVIMTGMLFIVAVVNIENLAFGILGYILARLICEFDEKRGVADTKATVIIGFMISSVEGFLLFTLLLIIFQFIYVALVKLTNPREEEYPFLPVYLLLFLSLLAGGYLM